MVAQSLLHRLEINLEAHAGIAKHGGGVENQRMTLMRCTERNCGSLRFTELQRLLPGLQSKAELVLGNDVLESFGAALVVPHLQEERIDHGTSTKRAVPHVFALEELAMRIDEGYDG